MMKERELSKLPLSLAVGGCSVWVGSSSVVSPSVVSKGNSSEQVESVTSRHLSPNCSANDVQPSRSFQIKTMY